MRCESGTILYTKYFVCNNLTYVLTYDILSTHPCIHLGSLNRVPALISWGKGGIGNVTSAGWQGTPWHASSRSGELCCKLLYIHTPFILFLILLVSNVIYNSSDRSSYEVYSSLVIDLTIDINGYALIVQYLRTMKRFTFK